VVPRGIRAGHTEWVGRKHDGSDGVRLVLGQTSTAAAATTVDNDRRGGGEAAGGGGPGASGVPAGLLAGLLCAGLYPQLAYLHAPPTKKGPASSSAVKLHVRPGDRTCAEPDAASVHPSSVNAQLDGNQWRSAYVAFHERVRTTKAGPCQMRRASAVEARSLKPSLQHLASSTRRAYCRSQCAGILNPKSQTLILDPQP
jgi:ATP-dependent RNA helicase DHX57